jgi:transcriptional regulator with XRE-family HTH domain
MTTVSNSVRYHRLKRGFRSLRQFAMLTEIDYTLLCRIETGTRPLSSLHARQIAATIGVSVDTLYTPSPLIDVPLGRRSAEPAPVVINYAQHSHSLTPNIKPNRLRAIRLAHNKSLSALASAARVDLQELRRIEAHSIDMPVTVAKRVAKVLAINYRALYTGNPP